MVYCMGTACLFTMLIRETTEGSMILPPYQNTHSRCSKHVLAAGLFVQIFQTQNAKIGRDMIE